MQQENWYLPYMDQKVKGIKVVERPAPVAVFYCAGASNVGQSTVLGSNEAARRLGYDRAALLCLASISAGLKNVSRAAAEARGIVAVDGCPMQCARRTLEKAGFQVNESLVVTRDCNVPKSFILEDAAAITNVAEAIVAGVEKIETGRTAVSDAGGDDAK